MKYWILIMSVLCIFSVSAEETITVGVTSLQFPQNDSSAEALSSVVLDTVLLNLQSTNEYVPQNLESTVSDYRQLTQLIHDTGSDYIIFGRLENVRGTYILSLSLFDAQAKTTVINQSLAVESLLDIFDLTDSLVILFLGNMVPDTEGDTQTFSLYAEGSGTGNDPYIIKTVSDLVNVGLYPDAHFRLQQDLDLEGINWVPIPPFSGTFDGDGHTIKNLSILQSKYMESGLFSSLGTDGLIKNLNLENVYIEGFAESGGLLAGNMGTVKSCNVIGGFISGEYHVGGLCGSNNGGLIEDSYAETEVFGHVLNIGGFVGINNNGTIIGCGSRGTVTIDGVLSFEDDEYPYREMLQSTGSSIGGFAGFNWDPEAAIIRCYAYSEITCSNLAAGGFCGGNISGSIEDCYFSGKLNSPKESGGFLGIINSRGVIQRCYALVETLNVNRFNGTFLGSSYSNEHRISQCFSFSLPGSVPGLPAVAHTVGNASLAGIKQMGTADNFLDVKQRPLKRWDFENVWLMTENGPILRDVPFEDRQNPYP